MRHDSYLDANRKLWNVRTPLHLASRFYDVDAFRAGESSLCGIELQEMGDLEGQSLLHLQCHFGLDSLSLTRHGAKVTGVDFSEAAIAAAETLAAEVGLPATFVCHDVLDLPNRLAKTYDVVFTSFGVLGWLPDLERWARVVAHFLNPGGYLYLLEFHRYFIQFDDQGELAYDYFYQETPAKEITSETYADRAGHEPLDEYWWNHSLSDVITAVLKAGLQVTRFSEFPYCAYRLNQNMVEVGPRRWVHRVLGDKIPYMFSLQAVKSLPTYALQGSKQERLPTQREST